MRIHRLLISVVLFCLATAASVQAVEPSRFLSDLMGRKPVAGKTFACYARVYDDAHLASHPRQNVRALQVLVTAYLINGESFYQLRMGLQFRNRPETFTTTGECGEGSVPDSVRRGAVCAGPGGPLRLSLDGKDSVLMSLPDGTELWPPGPPDPKNAVKDALGPDDEVFRLDRARLSECEGQLFDEERKALLDRSRMRPGSRGK